MTTGAIDPRLHGQYSHASQQIYRNVDALQRNHQAQAQAQVQQQQQQQQQQHARHDLHRNNSVPQQPYYLPPVGHGLQQSAPEHHNVDPALQEDDDSGNESSARASPVDADASQTPG